MAEIPFGEFLPDQQPRGGQSSLILNAYPNLNGYSSFNSIQPIGDPLDSKPLGAMFARSNAGQVRSFVGTQDKLYEVDDPFVDRSKVGGYTVIDGDNWEFIHWQVGSRDRILATNYNDPIQFKEMGSNDNFDDLPGNPPNARHIGLVREFVVVGNTNDEDGEKGNRVRWCAIRNEEEWTPATDQADFQDLRGNGGYVQRIFGGEYGIIFQERSIWRMEYVGSPLVWQFDEIEKNRGAAYPQGCAQFANWIFYLGRDGFYQLVDGSHSVPIGAEKVDRFFWDDFDTNYGDSLSCTIDPIRNVVIWSFPGAGSVDGVPNKSLIYNWETKRWSCAEFAISRLYFGATLSLTLEDLDPFGDLETLPFSLDSNVWKGGNEFLAGFTTDWRFGFFDGPPLTAILETTEIGGEQLTYIGGVRPFIESNTNPTVECAVVRRDSQTNGLSLPNWRALNPIGKADLRSTGRFQRIQVRIADGFEHANSVDADIKDRGRR